MIFIRKDQLNMTEGPFFKKLVIFALPVLLTGFLQLLYSAADLIVVGQFATSDAQGDFARTSSESFANMKRQLETNFESIKTTIGSYLLGPMKEVTEVLNTFLGDLIGEEKPRTILDEIADINIQKELKIADIEAVMKR